jgi:hypothetical protein
MAHSELRGSQQNKWFSSLGRLGGPQSMKALRLAWSLIQIPHLALSLFLFPLLIGLLLVFCQIVTTGLVLQLSSNDSAETAFKTRVADEHNVIRRVLYGDGGKRQAIRVCRWQPGSNGEQDKEPTDLACIPDQLDVVIQVQDVEGFDTGRYERLFDGHVDKLQICRMCEPTSAMIVIGSDGKPISGAYSPFGIAILALPYMDREIAEQRTKILRRVEEIRELLGPLSFHAPEVPEGFDYESLRSSLPLTLNVTLLMVIALWLALRAHRKVLDYFSQNNVLLPLVAATGKNTFYSALWALTAIRVGCFLFASVPIMYFGLRDVVGDDAFSSLPVSTMTTFVWTICLASTLALATIIASIAELKHRHSLLSIAYRYIPVLVAVVGAAVWSFSFLVVTPGSGYVRSIIAALPIVGMTPVFVAPAIKLPIWVLGTHAALSLGVLLIALKRNARWFAAHLEEV